MSIYVTHENDNFIKPSEFVDEEFARDMFNMAREKMELIKRFEPQVISSLEKAKKEGTLYEQWKRNETISSEITSLVKQKLEPELLEKAVKEILNKVQL